MGRCHTCGEYGEVGNEVDDPFVSCSGCGMWTHAQCFGVAHLHSARKLAAAAAATPSSSSSSPAASRTKGGKALPPADGSALDAEARARACAQARDHPVGAFTCALCEAGVAVGREPACRICSLGGPAFPNRAMKRVVTDDPAKTPKGVWAHICCSQWVPGAHCWRPLDLDDIGVARIDRSRWEIKCALCLARTGASAGATIECNHDTCRTAYHVLCARDAGWEMAVMGGPSGSGGSGGGWGKGKTAKALVAGAGASSSSSSSSFAPSPGREDTPTVLVSFCGEHSRVQHLLDARAAEAVCVECGSDDDPAHLILCDGCNDGYHTGCLRPKLTDIPEEDWYCPPCAIAQKALGTGAAAGASAAGRTSSSSSAGAAASSSSSSSSSAGAAASSSKGPAGTNKKKQSRLARGEAPNMYFHTVKNAGYKAYPYPVPPSMSAQVRVWRCGAGDGDGDNRRKTVRPSSFPPSSPVARFPSQPCPVFSQDVGAKIPVRGDPNLSNHILHRCVGGCERG
jgi:hypothetical protein